MNKISLVQSVRNRYLINKVISDIPSLVLTPKKLVDYFKDLKKDNPSEEFIKELFTEIESKGFIHNTSLSNWKVIYNLFSLPEPTVKENS